MCACKHEAYSLFKRKKIYYKYYYYKRNKISMRHNHKMMLFSFLFENTNIQDTTLN